MTFSTRFFFRYPFKDLVIPQFILGSWEVPRKLQSWNIINKWKLNQWKLRRHKSIRTLWPDIALITLYWWCGGLMDSQTVAPQRAVRRNTYWCSRNAVSLFPCTATFSPVSPPGRSSSSSSSWRSSRHDDLWTPQRRKSLRESAPRGVCECRGEEKTGAAVPGKTQKRKCVSVSAPCKQCFQSLLIFAEETGMKNTSLLGFKDDGNCLKKKLFTTKW